MPILATKLFIPPLRPKTTPRPRLITQLNAGLHHKLTLISAPAGFGKSTIANQWINACGRKAAWLSLDESDNQVHRFLRYVIAALQTISAEIGTATLAILQLPQPSATEEILTTLLNELVASSEPIILVLDDYHLITAQAVDQALTFLIDYSPPHIHWVMTTREDPQLPLARLRVRGQLTELRIADLRFTAGECATFLNRAMGLSLSAETIAALEARTEGWIAGLQLAAIALQGQQQNDTFIDQFTGSHHFILDYLVEEVLAHQSAQVRSFLLQTSILNRLSGPLCDAVTSSHHSKQMLHALHRDNLFLVPLDSTRHWYRYHHLFAEVLTAYLRDEQPARLSVLHQRASDWHANKGLTAEAIRHAFAAEDFDRAATLIEREWRMMDRTLQSATWLKWAQALPTAVISARPVLSVGYGWALLDTGALEEAERWLRVGERWLEGKGDSAEIVVTDHAEFQVLPATIASARAYLAQARGNIPDTIRYAQQAIDLLPPDDALGRAVPSALLGLAHWSSGALDAAYNALSTSMDAFLGSDNVLLGLSATFGMADIRITQGRLNDAVDLYQQALRLAETPHHTPFPIISNLHLGLSELYREQGKQGEADEQLANAQQRNDQDKVYQYRLLLAQAHIHRAAGQFDRALALLDSAEKQSVDIHIPDLKPAAAMKARVWIAQGNLADAAKWVAQASIDADDDLSFHREFEHVTLARLLFAQGAYVGGMALLDRLMISAESGGRNGSLIEILLLKAVAHHAQTDTVSALKSLAKPQRYIRLFVTEGQSIAQLLAKLQTEAQSHFPSQTSQIRSYLRRLQAAFPNQPAAFDSQPHMPPLLDSLSEREQEVLRLLTTDLSGPQIARELSISLNTMRTHTKNIYSKLGVNSRRTAVRRAKALNLL